MQKHELIAEICADIAKSVYQWQIRVGVTQQAADSYIDKEVKLYRLSQPINAVLKDISAIMEKSHNGRYLTDLYQIYAATRIIINDSKYTIASIPPGKGKSFIILLMAAYYRRTLPKKDVLILIASKFLEHQLDASIMFYLNDAKVTICHRKLPTKDRFSVTIIDESYELIAHNACRFDGKTQLAGVFSLKNSDKVHMLTANCSKFMKNLVADLPDCKKANCLQEFKTKPVIKNPNFTHEFLDRQFFEDEECIMQHLIKNVQGKRVKQPVIVFCEKEEEHIVT